MGEKNTSKVTLKMLLVGIKIPLKKLYFYLSPGFLIQPFEAKLTTLLDQLIGTLVFLN